MTLQQFDTLLNAVPHRSSVFLPGSVKQQRETQKSRQRGVVLTEQGWSKLLEMQVLKNRWGEWHTHQLLADRTLLCSRTIAKIVGREVGVDRRSLQQFFEAFCLRLKREDYCLAHQQ